MAYSLKSTGIAANCSFALMVDPDTTLVREFASSDVNTNMLIGGDITYGTQSWDGNTRDYWASGGGSGTAKFIRFASGHRPSMDPAGGYTLVAIYNPQSTPDSKPIENVTNNWWVASHNGGNEHPWLSIASQNRNGAQPYPPSNTKLLYGFKIDGTTSLSWFTALHDATSLTTGSLTAFPDPFTFSVEQSCYNANSVDRWHAILGFDAILSDAEVLALVDDWRTVMLESSGAPVITGPSGKQMTGGFFDLSGGTS